MSDAQGYSPVAPWQTTVARRHLSPFSQVPLPAPNAFEAGFRRKPFRELPHSVVSNFPATLSCRKARHLASCTTAKDLGSADVDGGSPRIVRSEVAATRRMTLKRSKNAVEYPSKDRDRLLPYRHVAGCPEAPKQVLINELVQLRRTEVFDEP